MVLKTVQAHVSLVLILRQRHPHYYEQGFYNCVTQFTFVWALVRGLPCAAVFKHIYSPLILDAVLACKTTIHILWPDSVLMA